MGPSIDWAVVFAEHGEMLVRVADTILRKRTVDGMTGEDIVGDVFAKLITNKNGVAETFTNHENQAAYLVTAVKNRCKDSFKRAAKQELFDPADADSMAGANVTPTDLPVDSEVIDAMMHADLAVAASTALRDLDERQRYSVEEVVMNERANVDVAPELGITAQRVGQLVKKGLRELSAHPAFVGHTETVSPVPNHHDQGDLQ